MRLLYQKLLGNQSQAAVEVTSCLRFNGSPELRNPDAEVLAEESRLQLAIPNRTLVGWALSISHAVSFFLGDGHCLPLAQEAHERKLNPDVGGKLLVLSSPLLDAALEQGQPRREVVA